MSISKSFSFQRFSVATILAGSLVGLFAAPQAASAFRFGGGGGGAHFGGGGGAHFGGGGHVGGGGGFRVARPSGGGFRAARPAHFVRPSFGGSHFAGGGLRHPSHPFPVARGPRGPGFGGHQPHFRGGAHFAHLPPRLGLVSAAYVDNTIEADAVDAPVEVAALPLQSTGPLAGAVSTPVATPVATCPVPKVEAGSFASVVFVPTITAADISTFLKAYNVSIMDGPTADGSYRLRLSTEQLPAGEVQKVIDSMRSQTAMITSAGA